MLGFRVIHMKDYLICALNSVLLFYCQFVRMKSEAHRDQKELPRLVSIQ